MGFAAFSRGEPAEVAPARAVPPRWVLEAIMGPEDRSPAAPPAAVLFEPHDPVPDWCHNGVLADVLSDLASQLHEVGNKAHDSAPLDADLTEPRVEIIAPHRRNRNRPRTRDGRRLRKYNRRWIVERFFARIQRNRRILIRLEYDAENFPGFVRSTALCLLLRPLYY